MKVASTKVTSSISSAEREHASTLGSDKGSGAIPLKISLYIHTQTMTKLLNGTI